MRRKCTIPSYALYVDSSTLAKWDVSEPRSSEAEAFLIGDVLLQLGSLPMPEWDCANMHKAWLCITGYRTSTN